MYLCFSCLFQSLQLSRSNIYYEGPNHLIQQIKEFCLLGKITLPIFDRSTQLRCQSTQLRCQSTQFRCQSTQLRCQNLGCFTIQRNIICWFTWLQSWAILFLNLLTFLGHPSLKTFVGFFMSIRLLSVKYHCKRPAITSVKHFQRLCKTSRTTSSRSYQLLLYSYSSCPAFSQFDWLIIGQDSAILPDGFNC